MVVSSSSLIITTSPSLSPSFSLTTTGQGREKPLLLPLHLSPLLVKVEPLLLPLHLSPLLVKVQPLLFPLHLWSKSSLSFSLFMSHHYYISLSFSLFFSHHYWSRSSLSFYVCLSRHYLSRSSLSFSLFLFHHYGMRTELSTQNPSTIHFVITPSQVNLISGVIC